MAGRTVFTMLVAALASLASAQNVTQAIGTTGYHWVDTWGSMPQLVEFANLPPSSPPYNQTNLVFNDTTIRMTIHTSIGGDQIRLRLSNRFGLNNLPITAVTIAYVFAFTTSTPTQHIAAHY